MTDGTFETRETIRDYKPSTYLGWIREMLEMIEKHGVFNIIKSVFLLGFISFFIYIVFNPEMIIDRVVELQEQKHKVDAGKRMDANPKVQNILNSILKETDATRAFVFEMHNGTKNSAGLPFLYVDMTYEEVGRGEGIERVSEDFQKLSISRFNICNVLYEAGTWCGNIDDIMQFDERAYYRLKSNNNKYMALILLHGVEDIIGFMGVTYTDDKEVPISDEDIISTLRKYSTKVSILLDGKAK